MDSGDQWRRGRNQRRPARDEIGVRGRTSRESYGFFCMVRMGMMVLNCVERCERIGDEKKKIPPLVDL